MNGDFYRSLDELEDLLEESMHVPLAKNKCIINIDRLRDVIDDIKDSLPSELKRSREVLENKEKMMGKVRQDSDEIMDKAKRAAEQMLSLIHI